LSRRWRGASRARLLPPIGARAPQPPAQCKRAPERYGRSRRWLQPLRGHTPPPPPPAPPRLAAVGLRRLQPPRSTQHAHPPTKRQPTTEGRRTALDRRGAGGTKAPDPRAAACKSRPISSPPDAAAPRPRPDLVSTRVLPRLPTPPEGITAGRALPRRGSTTPFFSAAIKQPTCRAARVGARCRAVTISPLPAPDH
jgi:hypothetical protein